MFLGHKVVILLCQCYPSFPVHLSVIYILRGVHLHSSMYLAVMTWRTLRWAFSEGILDLQVILREV